MYASFLNRNVCFLALICICVSCNQESATNPLQRQENAAQGQYVKMEFNNYNNNNTDSKRPNENPTSQPANAIFEGGISKDGVQSAAANADNLNIINYYINVAGATGPQDATGTQTANSNQRLDPQTSLSTAIPVALYGGTATATPNSLVGSGAITANPQLQAQASYLLQQLPKDPSQWNDAQKEIYGRALDLLGLKSPFTPPANP